MKPASGGRGRKRSGAEAGTPRPGQPQAKAGGEPAEPFGTPEAWQALDKEQLKEWLFLACLKYGILNDSRHLETILQLQRHAVTRLGVAERAAVLAELDQCILGRKGKGHMALLPFLLADDDGGICSTAAMSLAQLFDPEDGNELAGPEFVLEAILGSRLEGELPGRALGGLLLLGDRRLLPLLEKAWERLDDSGRVGLARACSGYVIEAVIEFYLGCLEKGCSDTVYGAVAAAVAKMPVYAQVPLVLEMERSVPAWRKGAEPLRFPRETPFKAYLKKISPRLKALEEAEAEPKVSPEIRHYWKRASRSNGSAPGRTR